MKHKAADYEGSRRQDNIDECGEQARTKEALLKCYRL
jgi:hypothetical protein